MTDKTEITEIGGKTLAWPVVCEVRLHDEGCELWCPEFGKHADGLDVEHARECMAQKLVEHDTINWRKILREHPAVRGTLLLRLSDNVLDPPEWPVYRVTLEHGKVVSREVKNRGVYSDSDSLMPGATIPDIVEWLAYDGTGTYPENFYSVFDPRDGRWHSFVGPYELDTISQHEITVKQWHEITKSFYHRP